MSTLKLTLLTDLYEMTMMQGYFKNNKNDRVVFDAFTAPTRPTAVTPSAPDWSRSLPTSRNFGLTTKISPT